MTRLPEPKNSKEAEAGVAAARSMKSSVRKVVSRFIASFFLFSKYKFYPKVSTRAMPPDPPRRTGEVLLSLYANGSISGWGWTPPWDRRFRHDGGFYRSAVRLL
jgi:hypothetical protein